MSQNTNIVLFVILLLKSFLVLSRLNQKAQTLYQEAMKANNNNDEETVYIYLMKYCEIVQIMKNTFKTDTNYIALMNTNDLKKALKMLTHITESLKNR